MIRTTFNAVMAETRDYLAQELRLDPSRVKTWARRSPPNPAIKADIFLGLRPGDGATDPDWSDPQGRVGTKVTRHLFVDIFSRLGLDEIVATDQWLDQHLETEDEIVEALQIYFPDDILAPFHWVGVSAEDQYQPTPGWGTSSLEFAVQFIQDLTQRSSQRRP